MCVCVSVRLFMSVCLSVIVCVAMFSIYILNINYVNSSALIFIIHNGPSMERIAICIHEHLSTTSPPSGCPASNKQRKDI